MHSNTDDSEFRTHLSNRLDAMPVDNSEEGFFKRMMMTHVIKSSKSREEVNQRLHSLDAATKKLDSDVMSVRADFEDFKKGEIAELKSRTAKIEKKLLIAYGVGISVISIPYVPTIFKFLLAGATAATVAR